MRVNNLQLKIAALIGFTALTMVTFLYLFTQAGGRLRLDEPYNAKALVPEALNIVNNSDVRSDGVKIGRVRSIEPAGSDSQIGFEIEDKDQDEIYRDATIRVRTKTLVGESYIDIEPGTKKAGILPSGSVIPLTSAKEVVPLERILQTLDPATRTQVRRNLDGIGSGLLGKGGDLNRLFGAAKPTVADGGKLMRVLAPQRRELAQLVGNTGVVTEALGERTASFRSLVVDAKTTADAVNSRDQKLAESLQELPATLDRAQSSVNVLAKFSNSATPVVRDLKLSSRDLAPAIRDLGPVARDTRTLFRELEPFLTKVDPLLKEITPASDKLRTVVAPLDALLRQANPALDFVKPYRKEFGGFFGNVSAALGAKDAYGNKGRVFAIVGPDSYTNFTKAQKDIVDALIQASPLKSVLKTQKNPYPKAGSIGNEKPFDGSYTRVEAGK
ncbi:MAG: MCE family protein [Solirubrobacterales bacterium]|nr:MCE family protein [Solirubrobacterales bacterium]